MYLFKPIHKATNLHRSFPSGHCFLVVLPPCLHGIGKAMVAVQFLQLGMSNLFFYVAQNTLKPVCILVLIYVNNATIHVLILFLKRTAPRCG